MTTEGRRPDDGSFDCPVHHVTLLAISKREAVERGLPFGCDECRQEVANAPSVAIMDGVERSTELRRWLESPMTVPFDLIHERAEALVGRPVWTHEFARPEGLYAEAASQEHPVDLEGRVLDTLRGIAADKPTIVVREGDRG